MKKKENKKLFKNTTQMIIYIILYIICIGLFIYVGKIDYSKNKVDESVKFSSLYNLVPENNLYVFSNHNDVIDILNGRSGVILFSFPSNKYANKYAYLLNKACLYSGVDKIYYYDFLKDRDESNGTYETIVNKLDGYVRETDEGIKDLYAPSILIVKKGKIIKYLDSLTFLNSYNNIDEYFEENEEIIYNEIVSALELYVK